MGKDNKNNLKGTLFGVLFLAWFFISIVGMIYFSEVNSFISVILFGQYFFVFSMIVFSTKAGTLVPLIHLTVGMLFMIIPFTIKVWPVFTDMSTKEYITDLGVPILSIIFGYYYLIKSQFENNDRNFKAYYQSSWLFFIIGIGSIIKVCL